MISGESSEFLNMNKNIILELKNNAMSEFRDAMGISNNIQHSLENIHTTQHKYEEVSRKYELDYICWCKVEENKDSLRVLKHKLNELKNYLQEFNISEDIDSYELENMLFELRTLVDVSKKVKKMLSEIIEKDLKNVSNRETNELKKAIYENFLMLKAYIEIKKINKELHLINKRNIIKKLVDKVIGNNNYYLNRISELENRKDAICEYIRTAKKYCDSSIKKYSTHEIALELEMYVEDNEHLEYIAEDLEKLKQLRAKMDKIFDINTEHIELLKAKAREVVLPTLVDENIKRRRKHLLEDDIKNETESYLSINGYVCENIKQTEVIGKVDDTTQLDIDEISNYIDMNLKVDKL